MQISVNLQSYILSPIVYLVLVILALLGLTIYFFNYEEKKKLVGTSKIEIKEVEERDRKSIIKRYLKKIDKLTKKVESEKIELRIEYQNLSKIIRNFVYEMTDIKVQNYSLQEIKKLDMKPLYELIEEYYKPEFAKHFLGNIKLSIDKTRKVIEKWN